MTDQNPDHRPAEPTHHTTVINTGEKSSGGGGAGLALGIGAILVVLAIVAYFLFARGDQTPAIPEKVDADIDINLPDAPKMPEMPSVPTPQG